LIGGALAQGNGIWSMHFIGMLALHLPVPIGYDLGIVSASVVVALVGSLIALYLTQRPVLSRSAWTGGTAAIGAAIAGLHYMDMAAMRMAADPIYNSPLVIASIMIAALFGFLGLFLSRRYQRDDPRRTPGWQWLSALLMSVAIVGQHYTAMAAVDFAPAPAIEPATMGLIIPSSKLPVGILASTLVILAVALTSAAIDRRRAARAALSQRFIMAQERERRLIAQILHEDVGQLLTALRLNLQHLGGQGAQSGVVTESITLVDNALSRVRDLSVVLRPSVLDDMGLAAAVNWYANREASRAGLGVTVQTELEADRVPEEVETAAFRILQQALTNVVRHAHASNVRVALSRTDREQVLEVTDDGVGFDVLRARVNARAGESLGLLSMFEMAWLSHGLLTIDSAAGGGTTVRVRFPLTA
jgi:signal transduction histidine kinase